MKTSKFIKKIRIRLLGIKLKKYKNYYNTLTIKLKKVKKKYDKLILKLSKLRLEQHLINSHLEDLRR